MNNLLNVKDDFSTLIYEIRGKQVMLDFDLAFLYGYTVKRLNEQVKRNIDRFPKDFMFRLTSNEVKILKSQFATASLKPFFNSGHGGTRSLPYAFTEQGVYMLSTVLKGEVAINQSIAVMRAFRDMRHFIKNNEPILERINIIETKQDKFQIETDKKFNDIYQKFVSGDAPTQKIFFEGQVYDSISLLIKIIKKAKNQLVVIDNYVDTQTLDLLSKKGKNLEAILYTTKNGCYLKDSEIKKFNQQYPSIKILFTNSFHDRFLIIDGKKAYCVGASLKDAGNKSFAISEIKDLNNIKQIINNLKKV